MKGWIRSRPGFWLALAAAAALFYGVEVADALSGRILWFAPAMSIPVTPLISIGPQHRGWPVFLGHDSAIVAASLLAGLAVMIRIHDRGDDAETRCAECGYILKGISKPRCPECGRGI